MYTYVCVYIFINTHLYKSIFLNDHSHLSLPPFLPLDKAAKIESSDRKRKKPPPPIYSSDRTTSKDKEHRVSSSAKKKTKMSSNQVRASHILIKHQGSRRKASWKDPDGRIISNTTRDAAVSQLKSLRDDIVAGKVKFDDVASRFSDCSSAKRGGDLGNEIYCLFFPFLEFSFLFVSRESVQKLVSCSIMRNATYGFLVAV